MEKRLKNRFDKRPRLTRAEPADSFEHANTGHEIGGNGTRSFAPSRTLRTSTPTPTAYIQGRICKLQRNAQRAVRVYYFSAVTGKRKGLTFDPELLYVCAMFHDMGLTPKHGSAADRFEVDGANTAREFLRQHKIPEQDIDTVSRWMFSESPTRNSPTPIAKRSSPRIRASALQRGQYPDLLRRHQAQA